MIVLALFTFFVQVTCEDQRIITTLKYSSYRVQPTIVSGEPVSNEKVPYLVSIKEQAGGTYRNNSVWSNLCGGSIIGERRVLTAAHCFEGNHYFYVHHPYLLRVTAGSNRTNIVHAGHSYTSPEIQIRQIAKLIMNRDFWFPNYDIALIITDTPWKFNDLVAFIAPATRTTDYPEACYAAGYGRTSHDDNARVSPAVLMAPIHVLSRRHCTALWQMDMSTFVCSDTQFGDVGKGDSGGPLACFGTNDPDEIPGIGVLVGIVSGKNFDKTTLYTRVSAHQQWIQTDAVSSNLPPGTWGADSDNSGSKTKVHEHLTLTLFCHILVLNVY